jgi:D-alanine-D-alanine ligase
MKVAILAGGLSNERQVSLWTGEQILETLPKEKYQANIVEVNEDGNWITELRNLKPDFAFIALHGTYGEDGRTQAVLDYLKIPYNGSGVASSAIGFDKAKCYQFLHGYGVFAPKFITIVGVPTETKEIDEIIKEHIGYPCVVKPNQSGSSFGVSIVKNSNELPAALEKSGREDSTIIVQQYIKGRELTGGVLGNSGSDVMVLPPVEIIPETEYFDFDAKYNGQSQEICPAQVPPEVTAKIQELSKLAHESLGCRGLTRSDFIWAGEQIYFLEINTLPGQTKESLCPKEARAIGMSFADFIEKQIELGMK